MPRSPLALAALATVAVPGLDAFDVRRSAHPGPGIDAAVVIDADGGRWVVRAPQDATGGAALEAEVALLTGLVRHVDAGDLPFDVPRPAGFVELPEGGRAVVHPQLRGRPLRLEALGPGPGLAAELGRAIAALHELPASAVEDAGLPVYEAEEYRQRRLSEVDEAARTGLVPASLLRRWEAALEDVSMWRFRPTVVHGDLSAEHVLCSATEPVALLGWAEAKVADPADDLAWLLVAAPQEAVDPILEAYALRRSELRDRHLAARALLAGELAVARWLLHGVRMDDAAIIDDASAMLAELDEHVTAADGESARQAEEARLEHEARQADEERAAEEARLDDEARLADEEARLADEAGLDEEARLAEDRLDDARLTDDGAAVTYPETDDADAAEPDDTLVDATEADDTETDDADAAEPDDTLLVDTEPGEGAPEGDASATGEPGEHAPERP